MNDRELLEAAAKAAGMRVLLDPVGEIYGRLRVVKEVERVNPRKRLFRCVCECGGVVDRNLNALRSGHTRSCGCLHVEAMEKNREKRPRHGRPTHGMSKSPEYSSWLCMRQRCRNPRQKNFAHYGGRGIKVCDRWDDFAAFLEDVGLRPAGHSLDRINVDGDYEPGNVRWATQQQQIENTRVVRMVTLNGKTQSVAAWTREMGLSLGQVQSREKAGWSTADAILTPSVMGQKRVITAKRSYEHQPRGDHGRYKAD